MRSQTLEICKYFIHVRRYSKDGFGKMLSQENGGNFGLSGEMLVCNREKAIITVQIEHSEKTCQQNDGTIQ